MTDPVNKPAHYNSGKIECIDAIFESMSNEEFCGYLKGNVLKYVWRYRYKGKPVEDLKKARWYLDRLIDSYETTEIKSGIKSGLKSRIKSWIKSMNYLLLKKLISASL